MFKLLKQNNFAVFHGQNLLYKVCFTIYFRSESMKITKKTLNCCMAHNTDYLC